MTDFWTVVPIARQLWASLKKAGIERFARVADRFDPSTRPEEADAPERLTTRESVACWRWDNAGEMDDSVFHRLCRSLRSAMWNRVYAVVTTLLTMLSLGGLLSLRFVGYYSHQALAVVLLLGFGWAVVSRLWLAWKGHLYPRLPRGFLQRESWPHFIQAVGRASFWAAAAVACLAVFPNSAEMTPIIAVLAGVSVLRIAASFLVSRRTNAGPTLVMAGNRGGAGVRSRPWLHRKPGPHSAACGAVRGRVAGVTGGAEPPAEPPSLGLQPMVCPDPPFSRVVCYSAGSVRQSCVPLRRAPRRTVKYASGALRARALL